MALPNEWFCHEHNGPEPEGGMDYEQTLQVLPQSERREDNDYRCESKDIISISRLSYLYNENSYTVKTNNILILQQFKG